MDVQTENTDPPPCETQSSGKIRKGFKLFGKRKPGNIFSIRNKGDGNNKSPVKLGKSLDGLSETTAPDSDKEKGHEVIQGEREQEEEEPLSEDGVLAAAPARTSISSASSAKSLSFLSLLRGGRRGVGDRRAHTVSQPVGRQRRGLKGLFGNVKFRSNGKEDKDEAPPSPLLMSSRANSVEIIKEDLTLTPKSQPRSLGSPDTESYDPIKSFTTQDSADTSPSDTVTPQVTTGKVSSTNEHVPSSPIYEPPLVPGDSSLSSLLADISSLLTFDSISGGDIMADVEAEWGKASSAISAVVTEVTSSSTSLFSKPSISSPLTSTFVSTAERAKPSPLASTQPFTPLTKTWTTSSPVAKPSTIITTLTKSSTLTTNSVKLSSNTAPFSGLSTSISPVALTSFSSPKTSSPSMITKSTLGSTSTTARAPLNTPATVVQAPSVSPSLTSTINKVASESAVSPAPVSILSPVATPAPVKPPITHSPPTPVTFTQHPPPKLDSPGDLKMQTSSSYKPFLSSVAAQSKTPATESLACTVTTKPPSPAPGITSKMTTAPTSTVTSSSVSAALSKPQLRSSPLDLNTTHSLATVPDLSSTFTSITKTQPFPASVPTSSLTSFDKIPPAYKPPPEPVSVDKKPPAPTQTSAPVTHADVSILPSTPPASGQILVPQSKDSSAPSPNTRSRDSPATVPIQVSQSKDLTSAAQIPVCVSKDLSAPFSAQVLQSKAPPAQAQIPVSLSKDAPVPAQIPVPVIRDHPSTAFIPVSISKETPAPAKIPVSVHTGPPPPVRVPISVSKDAPASAQTQVLQSKAPSTPTPAPCPVSFSLSSPTSSWQSEMRGSEQASMERKLSSPSSTDAQSSHTVPDKTEEQHKESSLHATPREKRIPQVKASGLSKIPVVGGGRAGKLPVRESQHGDDETNRDPPTPVLEEERPHFNSHDAGSKDKIREAEVNMPTSKHSQEESQPQKVLTSLPRDSKIPVKHSTSQIPQAKETPRTKIPVSKVPVRRAGNKPAASGGSTQIRK